MSQDLARAEDPVLHGAERQLGDSSDFVVSAVLAVAKQEELPELRREIPYRQVDTAKQLSVTQRVVGRRVSLQSDSVQDPLRRISRLGGEGARRRSLLAHMVDRAVGRDAVQPRREAVPGIEAREREVDLEEYLLSEIERPVAVAYLAVQVIDQRPLVAPHDLLERRPVASQGRADQVLVRRPGGTGGADLRGLGTRFHPTSPPALWNTRPILTLNPPSGFRGPVASTGPAAGIDGGTEAHGSIASRAELPECSGLGQKVWKAFLDHAAALASRA